MSLAQKLRVLRKQSGRTLAELAGLAGFSISYLSDIERGRTCPSVATCQDLAGVYRLTLSEFFQGVDEL